MIDLKFWDTKEKFLLLEVLPRRTAAYFLTVNEEHHLKVDTVKHAIGAKELATYLQMHRAKQNIIVAAHSSLVVTSILPVHIERTNRNEALTTIELENLLSKAIGQIFNQCRSSASEDLGVDDLDTILVNSQVVQFKIDSHQVLNPAGFKAKTIEAIVELTLTTRQVFERLKVLLKSHKTFFFTESGRSELASLRKIFPLPLTLVNLNTEHSMAFVMKKAAVGHQVERKNLIWRSTSFAERLSEAFAIYPKVAVEMYDTYLQGTLSPHSKKYLGKLIDPDIQSLLAELKLGRFKGTIYIDCDRQLPFSFPLKTRYYTLVGPPLEALLQATGLTITESEWQVPREQILRHLAPFLEFYFRKNESHVNQWLKRHLNWLGASV